MKVSVISIVIDTLGTMPKGLVKSLELLAIEGFGRANPNYGIAKIGQNSE